MVLILHSVKNNVQTWWKVLQGTVDHSDSMKTFIFTTNICKMPCDYEKNAYD